MPWIFEIEDKSGRKMYLSKERWSHIVTEHPQLANKIEEIKDTVLNSLVIRNSKYDKKVKFYYKFYKDLSKYLLVSAVNENLKNERKLI